MARFAFKSGRGNAGGGSALDPSIADGVYQSANVTVLNKKIVALAPGSAGLGVVSGTAGQTVTAGKVYYLDGTNARGGGFGKWYRVNFASGYYGKIMGVALSSVTSGNSVNFRVGIGRVTGFTGLTAGADVYIGANGSLGHVGFAYVGYADTTESVVWFGPLPEDQKDPADLVNLNPTFTGATTDGWTASASTTLSTNYPWTALDADTGTYWHSDNSGLPQWVKVVAPSVQTFYGVELQARTDFNPHAQEQAPYDFKIQGREQDGSTWSDLSVQTGLTWAAGQLRRFLFAKPCRYDNIRVYITANSGAPGVDNYTSFVTLNLLG